MALRYGKTFVAEQDYPVVSTTAGKYLGYIDDEVFTFKGMEYAYADRFQMPEPPHSFEGVRDAYNYGYGVPEMTYNLKGKKPGDEIEQIGMYWNMDEHLHHVNVWTRSIDPGAKKPVIFFIHGGGYFGGASNHLFIYDGWALAHEYDVVMVSINHRLNMLGYLDLSSFGERYKNSGNLGQADIVAALQWVKENIARFGGDPDNVTLLGQSGGGGKICTLLQMPAADGLYHKAIIQSGVFRMGLGISSAPKMGEETAKVLGLTKDTIQEIETIDYDTLAAAALKAGEKLGVNAFSAWGPKADGEYYLGDARDVGFRPETANIPILIGSDLREFDPSPLGRKENWSREQRLAAIRQRFGGNEEAIAKAFEKAYPELDVSYAAAVDTLFRQGVVEFTHRRIKDSTAPVYSYIFAYEMMIKGGKLGGHGMEMNFMFHNAPGTPGIRKGDVTFRLQDQMAGAWAAFAKTGSPNGENLPQWPAFTKDQEACMVFGDDSRAADHVDAELLDLILGNAPKALPEIEDIK